MKFLLLILALLMPHFAVYGQLNNADTSYRNDGETLTNGSFEQGKKGFTFSVGSGSLVWATQSTTAISGKAMKLTLASQTFSFKSNTTQGASFLELSGYVEAYIKTSVSGSEFCPLVDGVSQGASSTPNECQPIVADGKWHPYGIQKVFGATSLNYEIRNVSGAITGDIYIDDSSVAKKSIVANMSGAQLMGAVVISGCASNWVTSSTTFAEMGVQTGCSYSLTGSAQAPSTNLPAIKFASLPAGDYRIEFEGALRQGSANFVGYYQFWDGTNTARETSAQANQGGALFTSGISQTISYNTQQSNVTLSLRGKTDSGGQVGPIGTNTLPATIKLWYFPKQPISTINTSNGWFIDANIGGANAPLPSTTSTYSEVTNTGLDLVNNTSKGSAPVEIACVSGTNSSGVNCGANAESIGIAFTPPKTGTYKVCSTFSLSLDSTNTGNNSVSVVTQLVETPNNAVTISQEGGDRVTNYIYKQNLGTGGIQNIYPNKNCGLFKFNDTSKKTIRLMYEASALGQGVAILADRDTTQGQRDVHWTVEPIAENIQAGLQGYVSSSGVISPKLATASISSTGIVTNDYSDFINGNCTMSGGASSTATCTFTSGFFTTYSACWAPTPPNAVLALVTNIGSNINSVVRMQTPAGSDNASAFQLFCWGF